MKMTTSQSPTIIVSLTQGVTTDDIAQLLYGMEEEGIPFRLTDEPAATLTERAYRAANDSPLLVGVAVSREEIVIHYKNLPADNPLFILKDYSRQEKQRIRDMGCNAARLVKGLPFKEND